MKIDLTRSLVVVQRANKLNKSSLFDSIRPKSLPRECLGIFGETQKGFHLNEFVPGMAETEKHLTGRQRVEAQELSVEIVKEIYRNIQRIKNRILSIAVLPPYRERLNIQK